MLKYKDKYKMVDQNVLNYKYQQETKRKTRVLNIQ